MTVTTLIGPDGREYDFDDAAPGADLATALKSGYRQPGADGRTFGEAALGAVHDVGEAAGAAALGVTQGLTAGAYGAVTGAVDPALGAEMLAEQQESPIAYGVGELTGMVTSPLNAVGAAVTGGVGAATRLGRVASQALGGATVGSLYGAGNAASEASLGNLDITAEKLLAGAGLGALLGAAGGGLGGLLDEGVKALAPKLGTLIGKTQSALDDVANDAAIKSTRAMQGELNKVGDDRLRAAAEAMRSRGHLRLSPEKMAEAISKDVQGVGALKGKFIDEAEAVGRPVYSAIAKRLDEFEAGINPLERQAIAADLRGAREALSELGSRPVSAVGKGGSSFRALDDLKQTIQAKAKFSKGPVPLDDVTFGLKRQLAGIFRDELDQQLLPVLGADAGKAFLESKALYGALKDAERLAISGANRTGGFGLKDMAAAAIGGNLHPMGIVAGIGNRVLREGGPAIIARLADGLAKSPVLATIAKSFATKLAEVAPRMGQYGPMLAQEASLSAERAMAVHMAYSQLDPGYSATAQLAGLVPEAPDEHDAALSRATGLTAIQAKMKAQSEEVKSKVDRVFKGGKASPSGAIKSQDFGSMRMRRDSPAAYQKRVEEVRQLAADPEALLDRVTKNMGPMSSIAPGVAASMTAAAQRAVTYLAQAAEEPSPAGPMAAGWSAPEAERFIFGQKLQVVERPFAVLDHAAAGTLTETHVEALKAVYPQLWQEMADAALEKMADGPKGVPYQQRLMLSMLTGIDVDGTMSQASISRNQEAMRGTKEEETANAPPKSGARNSEMTLAARTALPSQRRELES